MERGGRAVKAEHLTLRYQDQTVLSDLTMALPDEGITLLTGPSGVGKTTLLRVFAGLLSPDEGTVSVPGRPVMLFQEDRLFPRCTVRKQVEAVLPGERREEALRWLELVELSEAADKLPGELSGGMARRAALARALAVEGEVWLLDEPFAGVDPQRAERILKRLKELDRPILLTGHAPWLEMWCDRVAALPGERG